MNWSCAASATDAIEVITLNTWGVLCGSGRGRSPQGRYLLKDDLLPVFQQIPERLLQHPLHLLHNGRQVAAYDGLGTLLTEVHDRSPRVGSHPRRAQITQRRQQRGDNPLVALLLH